MVLRHPPQHMIHTTIISLTNLAKNKTVLTPPHRLQAYYHDIPYRLDCGLVEGGECLLSRAEVCESDPVNAVLTLASVKVFFHTTEPHPVHTLSLIREAQLDREEEEEEEERVFQTFSCLHAQDWSGK